MANSRRTLECIGWHHAEAILRSLAYALLEYAQYGVDRLNLGGEDVDSEYHRQGNAYMRRYREMLKELRTRGGVISARLYTPVESGGGRDVVAGP